MVCSQQYKLFVVAGCSTHRVQPAHIRRVVPNCGSSYPLGCLLGARGWFGHWHLSSLLVTDHPKLFGREKRCHLCDCTVLSSEGPWCCAGPLLLYKYRIIKQIPPQIIKERPPRKQKMAFFFNDDSQKERQIKKTFQCCREQGSLIFLTFFQCKLLFV